MRPDWPSIGARFFSWIAGIALVPAAVLLFRAPAANGWLTAR
jgi:glucose dehydrogenase